MPQKNNFYNDVFVNKPWGYEYMVYTQKNNIGVKTRYGKIAIFSCL